MGATLWALLVRVSTAGAAGDCLFEKQKYPENAVICSSGLVLFCANGQWQNTDGARCNAPGGTYLTPLRPFGERYEVPPPPALTPPAPPP